MKSKVYLILCGIIVCSIFCAAVYLLSAEGFDSVPAIKGERSNYTIYRTELVPRERITSFCVDAGRIFVYYDNTALINVYTTDGVFEYGIQISSIPNGQGDMAVHNGDLFLKSRRGIAFIFHGDKLVETLEPGADNVKYASALEIISQEKNVTDENTVYKLSEHRNDIVRLQDETPILNLPQRSSSGEHLLIVGMLVLVISLELYKKLFKN